MRFTRRRPAAHIVLSDRGVRFIAVWEGFRSFVYRDVAGIETIGYGHVVLRGERFPPRISVTRGREILRADTRIAQDAVRRAVHVRLHQHEFDALVSLAFNIGAGAFANSTLVRLLNRRHPGHRRAASREFPKWNRAAGHEVPGLTRRRRAERALFLGR